MSSYEYEDYVRDQRKKINQVLVTEDQIKEQKQVELRQVVYDELLKKYNVLQNEIKEKNEKIEMLEAMVVDDMEKLGAYEQDRWIKIPYEKMRLMFLLQERPEFILCCIDKENNFKCAKAPNEIR